MKTILFHELNEKIVNFIIEAFNNKNHPINELLNDCEFTFDDGLYSQFKYVPKLFKETNIKCTIFVSSEFVYKGSDQQIIDIIAPEAHKLGRTGDLRSYCTVNNILELNSLGIYIGNHSATHFDFNNITGIKNILNQVKKEVEISTKFFLDNGIITHSFAYPYNNKVPFYETLLKSTGIKYFYGKERINIDTLIK